MNRNQKLVLCVGGLVVFVLSLFPSWVHIFPDSAHMDAGRYFILKQPDTITVRLIRNSELTSHPQMEMDRLFLEWVLLIAIAGALILFLADDNIAGRNTAPFDRRIPGGILMALFTAGLYAYGFPISGLGAAPAFLIFIALMMILALLVLLFFDVPLHIARRGSRWMKALLFVEASLGVSFSVWWVIRFLRYMAI